MAERRINFCRGAMAVVLLILTVASAAVAREQVVTLEYWHHYGGTFGQVQQKLVEEFNATHPTIVVQAQYAGTAWTARDKLFVALAGGGGPALGLIDQFWAAPLAEAGFLQRMEDFFPEDFPRDDILDVMWETATYEGSVWSMPSAISNLVLYYNKDMFREAGLDPERPPQDWDELYRIGRILSESGSEDGRQGRQWGLDMPLLATEGNVYYWITFLWQMGGELFTEDNRAAAFNEASGVETLAFWQRLLDDGIMTLTPPANGWEMGFFGMKIASSARLGLYTETLPFDFGVAPLPRGQRAVTGLGGNNIAIFTSDPVKQEAAWQFVEWLTSPEVNRRWAIETGYAPLRYSVLNSPEFQQYLDSEPRARVALSELSRTRPRPNIPAYADASRELGSVIEAALFGRWEPERALETAELAVNRVLSQYKD